MTKPRIKSLIKRLAQTDGLTETGVEGVMLFRATSPVPCAPAVYEPSVIAIVSGHKEAVLDGERHVYDDSHYLCCPMSMPVQAGTPSASPDTPLFGVYIALNPRIMTELTLEMENAESGAAVTGKGSAIQGVRFADWDKAFSDALWRLVQLAENPMDAAALGDARLRELSYAVLKGEAGHVVRRAFGPGNAIARSISDVSANLGAPISIEQMAAGAGMSRAVFHRKFREVTTMSPLQFVKSMRLNKAAMKIAGGMTVNEAALDVGYASASQFSREFKRMYGQSPRQWGDAQRGLQGAVQTI